MDRKKIIFFLLVVSLTVSALFAYQNYSVDSIRSNNNSSPFSDIETTQGDNSDNNTIVKENDTLPPDTKLLSGVNGTINYDNVTFTWVGTDDTTWFGHLLYSYKLTGKTDTWSDWSSQTSRTYINLRNGQYTFYVKAKDQAGNVDLTPVKTSFVVAVKTQITHYYLNWLTTEKRLPLDITMYTDKNKPFIKTISIPQDNLENISFKLTWKDDVTTPFFNFGKDTLRFVIDSPNGTQIYNGKSKGEGTMYFTVSDINSKPSITSIDAENLSEALGKLTKYYNTNWKDKPIQLNISIHIGEIRLLRQLKDKGNDFNLQIYYTYYKPEVYEAMDNPPETIILSGPTGLVNYSTVTFSWTGSDNITPAEKLEYSYKLAGYDSFWSSWLSENSVTYSNLPEGEYTFFVKAEDEAGNIDPTPAEQSFKFKIDKEGGDTVSPETIITDGPNDTINHNNVTFSWAGSDDITPAEKLEYSYKLLNYDTVWSNWTYIISKTYINLENGQYTFIVRAEDEAGNIDPTPAEQSFTVEDIINAELDRFATKVIDFTGVGNTNLVLGGPRGAGGNMGSTHVLSLGIGGSLTVGFNVTIFNGPGEDFIVFENPFFVNTDMVFAELAYVEVSTDGVHFVRFPSSSTTINPVTAYNGIYPENVTNLAGVHPVFANVNENDVDPFDPSKAGGDAFDLDDLTDEPLVENGLVDLQCINYVRITDILGDGSCLDSNGNPIYDPTGPGMNGADIDSLAVINYLKIG